MYNKIVKAKTFVKELCKLTLLIHLRRFLFNSDFFSEGVGGESVKSENEIIILVRTAIPITKF